MNINILRYSLFGIAGGQEVDLNFSKNYYLPSYNDCITVNAYNDFKFLAKEKFKAGGNVSLSDLTGICFRYEKFSTILCLFQICSSFQASSADCERGFSIMNTIKTKNRCRLEPYHLDQLMVVNLS